MKSIFFISLFVTLALISSAQISTTKVPEPVKQLSNTPYDSTENFLGINPHKYIGQDLYLKGMHESSRSFGYEGFLIDYKQSEDSYKNTYKPVQVEESYKKYDLGGGRSNYDSLAGKYFSVLEVIKHPEAETNKIVYGNSYFLKLKEKNSGDLLYFLYNSKRTSGFPFLVVGYFEKIKKGNIGNEFIFSNECLNNKIDIITLKPITQTIGQLWKCVDLTIDEKYFNLALVVENPIGERVLVGEYCFNKTSVKYFGKLKQDAEALRKSFGLENFNLILQGKVKLGMSKEMCRLSWGEPDKINQTIVKGLNTEQWVYKENYLYFDNGILNAMQ